jgi:hypothetical protein
MTSCPTASRRRHCRLDFQVPKPRAKKPIDIARRNIINHIRSPTSHPLTSNRKKPAPIAKYHQAKSRARSPFPMFMFTLDAVGPLADAIGSCDIMVQFLIDRAPQVAWRMAPDARRIQT